MASRAVQESLVAEAAAPHKMGLPEERVVLEAVVGVHSGTEASAAAAARMDWVDLPGAMEALMGAVAPGLAALFSSTAVH
jgi:hypothetical protein